MKTYRKLKDKAYEIVNRAYLTWTVKMLEIETQICKTLDELKRQLQR